jgi:hypothetical protein
VGVCTGRVYVGRVGDPHRAEISVLGDTVNTAARLMAHAAANRILVPLATETTHAAVCTRFHSSAAVELEPLDHPLKAKGKASLLSVYRVLRVSYSEASSRRRLGLVYDATFVGRENDVDAVVCTAIAASEGVTEAVERVAAVFGDSGMGKSHLVQAAATRCEARLDARTLLCSSSLDTCDQPFLVAGQLLAQVIDHGDAAELHLGRWAGQLIPPKNYSGRSVVTCSRLCWHCPVFLNHFHGL